MLITATTLFAKISAQCYPILALFVLIDRTTCQLTEESVTASSGSHFFCFLVIYPMCTFFLKLTPKMCNLKLKISNKKSRKRCLPNLDFIKEAHFSRLFAKAIIQDCAGNKVMSL